MKTRFVKVDPLEPDDTAISEAAELIKKGGLVGFPTETVYGLGGSALSESACDAIFEAKGRERDNPLIVHICSVDQLEGIACDVPEDVKRALQVVWPGPITFVLKREDSFPSFSSKYLDTVAVRMPAHPVALELIRASGVPIAAPSANRSGRPSPTTGSDVNDELDGRIDMILDSGPATFGVESTVIDVTRKPYSLLRPGAYTIEDLSKYLGEITTPKDSSADRPKAPGMKYRHYAPSKRLGLASEKAILELAGVNDKRLAILCSDELGEKLAKDLVVIKMGSRSNPFEIAKNLFSSFRKLERSKAEIGIIEPVEERGIGLAVMNRVKKATEGLIVSSNEQMAGLLSPK